jgi:hypothetical protein
MIKCRLASFLLAASILTLADGKPDFSGNWKMDATLSDFGGAPPPDSFTRKIEHSEPSLIFTDEQTSALGQEKAVRRYSTDGKETTYQWMNNEVKSAAHWEGSTMVIVGKLEAGGAEIVVTSLITLSEDRKTLTETDKIASGGSEIGQFKVVLIKQ